MGSGTPLGSALASASRTSWCQILSSVVLFSSLIRTAVAHWREAAAISAWYLVPLTLSPKPYMVIISWIVGWARSGDASW